MKLKIADLPELKYRPTPGKKKNLIQRFARVNQNWRLKEQTQELEPICNNLVGTDFHANYLEYLEKCWANHYGVVMTPDILWHTLMSEAVLIVAENSKKYATLFTTTPEQKQTIIVPSASLVEMPLDILTDAIKPLLPTDPEVFLPDFSTSNRRSRFARLALFADLVSPYYNYMMYCCGIPYVDVRGEVKEYEDVARRWQEIGKLLSGNEEYFQKTGNVLNRIVKEFDSVDLWKDMFRLKTCGSGSQNELYGWFTDLFRTQPSFRLSENFATHLAKVSYHQLNTQKDFEMYHGVMNSSLKDDCLEPEFGSVIYEKLKEPKTTPFNNHEWEEHSLTVGVS